MTAALVRRDLAVLWLSPLVPVLGAAMHVVVGLLLVAQLQLRGQAVLAPAVPIVGLLLLVAAAVVTRGLATDAESGQLDLLLAVPVAGRAIVVGAWLSSWLTLLALVAPTAVVVLLVAVWGDPDAGAVTAATIGLAVLAAAASAVGVLVASLTRSPVTAGAVTLLVLLGSWFLPTGPTSPLRGWAAVSLSERMRAAAAGGVDLGSTATLLALAVVCLVVAATVLDRPRARVLGRGRGRFLLPAGVAATVVVLATVVDLGDRVVDLTADRTLSLQPATLDVLDAVDAPTQVTAFLSRDAPGYDLLDGVLGRYRDRNPLIEVRVLDPEDAPGEVRRLQADVFGAVVVAQGERLEHAPTATEADLTAAFARLVRDEVPLVCAATGHGELSLTSTAPDGLTVLAGVLEQAGFRTTEVDLLATQRVDERCDVLLFAGPRTPFGTAGPVLRAWLEDGGRVLLLADPVADLEATALLVDHGVALDRGIVIEGDPAAHIQQDPTTPIIARYSSAHPVVRALAPMVLPGTQGVLVDDEQLGVDGLAVSRLADTSPASHLDRAPLSSPTFDEEVDVRGPVTVAAAAERAWTRDRRSRVVVVGDVDVATNAGVEVGANTTFLLQAVTWLADAGDLTVSPNLPRDRPLALTPARIAYLRLVSAGAVPVLFLLGGAITWAARRRR